MQYRYVLQKKTRTIIILGFKRSDIPGTTYTLLGAVHTAVVPRQKRPPSVGNALSKKCYVRTRIYEPYRSVNSTRPLPPLPVRYPRCARALHRTEKKNAVDWSLFSDPGSDIHTDRQTVFESPIKTTLGKPRELDTRVHD